MLFQLILKGSQASRSNDPESEARIGVGQWRLMTEGKVEVPEQPDLPLPFTATENPS